MNGRKSFALVRRPVFARYHRDSTLLSFSFSASRLETARTCGKWLIRFYFPRRRLSLAMVLVTAVTSSGYAPRMQALALDSSRLAVTLFLSRRTASDYRDIPRLHFRSRTRAALCNAKPCSLYFSSSPPISVCIIFFFLLSSRRTKLRGGWTLHSIFYIAVNPHQMTYLGHSCSINFSSPS